MTWDITRIVMVASLLIFTGLFRWLPQAVPPIKLPAVIKSRDPDYYIENFNLTAMSEQGRPKYLLKGVGLVHLPNEENSRIDKPYLVQYEQPDAQNNSYTLTTADTGWISADGKRLLMSGNVQVVRGEDKNSVSTEVTANEMVVLLN